MTNTIYYTYKIEHTNGKYYVGRHSTDNLDDGYLGSGKWVTQIKDKNSLTKTILNYYDTFEDLLEGERALIKEHIDNENNMNFNNNPIGFASGDLNPSKRRTEAQREKLIEFNKSEETRRKRKEHNESLVEKGEHLFQNKDFIDSCRESKSYHARTNNPMFREEQKKRHSEDLKRRAKEGTHNFQNPEIRKKSIEINRKRLQGEGNPMKDPEVAAKFKKPKPKVKCPHCGKEGGKPVMMRYHFDNCKFK